MCGAESNFQKMMRDKNLKNDQMQAIFFPLKCQDFGNSSKKVRMRVDRVYLVIFNTILHKLNTNFFCNKREEK